MQARDAIPASPDGKAVLDRLQQVFEVRSDAALARTLKFPGSTVASWRSRGSVPYEVCVDIAIRKGKSLDWLLFGHGERELSDAVAANLEALRAGGAVERASLDAELLTSVIEAIEEARPELSPAKKARAIAALYELMKGSPTRPERATLLQFVRNVA